MYDLVTGGFGFIGGQLVAALLESGRDVVVLDNFSRNGFHYAEIPEVTGIEGDIADETILHWLFANFEFDRVFNLAAISNVRVAEADPERCWASNVTAAHSLFTLSREYGCTFVQASSREVYGNVSTFPVNERAAIRPANVYGESKAAAELPGMRILRLANVYGPTDAPPRVLPSFMRNAAEGRPLVLNGGNQVIDFISVRVVVEAFMRMAELPDDCSPINIGSGQAVRLIDLAGEIAARAGVEISIKPAIGYEVKGYQADTTKMETILGIDPPTNIIEDIFMEYEPVLA